MKLHFKFKGDEKIYCINGACTTMIWGVEKWQWYRTGLFPQRFKGKTPLVAVPEKEYEDIEWIEYRCVPFKGRTLVVKEEEIGRASCRERV